MKILAVSSLIAYLKKNLDEDSLLKNILVKGEISNFKKYISGHLYFTLKDESAQINCVMFSSSTKSLSFDPKNGDKVLANGRVSIYESSGQLQLYINSMKIDGIGDLYQQYEELKNKLQNDGYFNNDHKKPFNIKYPNKIAVLVGDKSAAMSDIKTTFLRRWPLCEVDYYPVLVQGKEAAKDIINRLMMVDKLNYEAIILARGGGSFEDLFCFNDEQLIKCIYNLNTFICTGVGHEQDYTLVDFVSDLRAPTPTAAVELLTPKIDDIYQSIVNNQNNLYQSMDNKLMNIKNNLELYLNNKYFKNPSLIIEKEQLKLQYFNKSLDNFSIIINKHLNDINNLFNNLKNNMLNLYRIKNTKLKNYIDLLNAYSYENTLKRGFSVIYKNNQLIKKKEELNNNDLIEIKMYDGTLNAEIKEN